MIFQSTKAKDDISKYPEAIQKAIRYASETDFSRIPDGRQEIDGERMFANLFHIDTKTIAESHPELHEKYVDVQYWIEGEELCGIGTIDRIGKEIERRAADDIYFVDHVDGEFFIHPTQGCFAVFFPNDAHRPGIAVDGMTPVNIRKVVVKVSIDLL